ncbi:UDP-galactopyranose mutase [Synergistales bacterium]|nr:UDP-galactopyranose mutase [Synergistales bacterium]
MYDIVVVGSGFSGSIIARKLAEECGKKVLLLEQRSHVGGNMYDERDERGILIHKHGPHLISTNRYWIIEYLERYAELVPHNAKLLSFIDGKYVRLPFNFTTLQQLVSPEKVEGLLAKMREVFAGRDRVSIFELVEHADTDIRDYGDMLFKKAYKTYIAKQWGCSPSEIDRSVLERALMCIGYDERYLNKDFQRLPKYGFTKLFENMLDHPDITVKLNCNAFRHLTLDESSGTVFCDGVKYQQVIFTGAIDELLSEKFGRLPYRSIYFHYEVRRANDGLPCEIVSYPQAEGYTRRTEYRRINYIPIETDDTVIVTEYPVIYDKDAEIGNLPYYPVLNVANTLLYQKYVHEAQKYSNLFLCGRLAEYKYYNMDAVIESTFEKFNLLKTKIDL